MKTIIAIAAVAIMLTACQQKPDEDAIKECWSPEAKATVSSLAKEFLVKKTLAAFKASGEKSMPTSELLSKALTVTMSDFYTKSLDRVSDSAVCGARVEITLAAPDMKPFHASGRFVEFQISRAENSRMYSLTSTLPLEQLLNSADTFDSSADAAAADASSAAAAADAASQ